ncbi:MAG: hypothetical protein IT536_07910 [Hyphomicrobiales bacterium]|nr:hypothetical protein [Hyphomicrobiales bacterium]
MLATLAVFFVWVEPANRATSYWTLIPADWQSLRQHWERGHAVNAIITFVALCAATWSVLLARD